MKTTVNTPDLKNFLDVLLGYSVQENNPYMINAVQQMQEYLLGVEGDTFLPGLLSYTDEHGNSVDFVNLKK